MTCIQISCIQSSSGCFVVRIQAQGASWTGSSGLNSHSGVGEGRGVSTDGTREKGEELGGGGSSSMRIPHLLPTSASTTFAAVAGVRFYTPAWRQPLFNTHNAQFHVHLYEPMLMLVCKNMPCYFPMLRFLFQEERVFLKSNRRITSIVSFQLLKKKMLPTQIAMSKIDWRAVIFFSRCCTLFCLEPAPPFLSSHKNLSYWLQPFLQFLIISSLFGFKTTTAGGLVS